MAEPSPTPKSPNNNGGGAFAPKRPPSGAGGLRYRRSGGNSDSSMLHALPSSREMSNTTIEVPRLIPRNLNYGQSHNRLRITRINGEVGRNNGNKQQRLAQKELYGGSISHLLWLNWFHVVMRYPSQYTISVLLVAWTVIVLVFAGIYVGLDTLNKDLNCGLGPPGIPIAWGTAFAFSLETCTTVGCTLMIIVWSLVCLTLKWILLSQTSRFLYFASLLHLQMGYQDQQMLSLKRNAQVSKLLYMHKWYGV